MRILYLHQYFKTPEEGGAIRSWYIVSALAKEGHEVEVVSGSNSNNYWSKGINGFRVHYLPVKYNNSMGKWNRGFSFLKFLIKASLLVFRLKRFDKTYVTSTPLTIGLVALLIFRVKKTPYIFEVRDLWPEAPVQLGFIKNPVLKRLLNSLEYQLYLHSEAIVALSPGILEGVRKKYNHASIHLIPNMSDVTIFSNEPKSPELESKYGVRNKFVISYTGAIGFSNHLDYLIEAAKVSQENDDRIQFIVAGDGADRLRIIQLAGKYQLKNIRFLGLVDKNAIKEILIISDAVYISFGPFLILETNSPNKFFDGLAAGKAIITNTKGWIKELVETNNCGFYYDPEKPENFTHQIKELLDNQEQLEKWKMNARKLAEEQFSVKELAEKVCLLFK